MKIQDLQPHIDQLSIDKIDKVVVGGVIFNTRNEILLVKRHGQDFYGGFWEFPSGNIDGNEDLLTALSREILEETGIRISHDKNVASVINHMDYFGKDGFTKKRQINFAIFMDRDPKVVLSEEHTDHVWHTKNGELDLDKVLENQLDEIWGWLELMID